MNPVDIKSLGEFQRRPLSKESTGAATEYLLDKAVEPRTVFIVTRFNIENKTTAFTKLRFGIYKTGSFIPVEEALNPAKDTLYTMSEELFAYEGERVGVEIVGATDGDNIRAHIEGYKKKLD